MPKNEKVKVKVKERVEDNSCDLSLSELTEIPVREIASFKRVTSLDLSSNRLITLGKNFTTLTRLVKLDLSKNQIKQLPEDFGLLRNLRHLDLYDNELNHLPLSFGNLTNLRYLDLKGNPLVTALAKVVGFCLTNKECQESARNTVKFLARMQTEAETEKEKFSKEKMHTESEPAEEKVSDSHKTKKSANKPKTKSKHKKSNSNVNNNNDNSAEATEEIYKETPSFRTYKASLGIARYPNTRWGLPAFDIAFMSITIFFLLLFINICILYMVMYQNPDFGDKIIELIPPQYRDWLVTKTEFFRLRVTDWISQFRTPPEEQ